MTDTQWPRYEVFVQEREGEPHMESGSVHAADPEMALFNARDVFARRPACTSMWVIPAGAIFSRTAEELAARPGHQNGYANEKDPGEAQAEIYYVACKQKSAGMVTVVGTVEAASPEEALKRGIEAFGGQFARPPFVWWVFPRAKITASTPEDIESMYAPAEDKPFRLSSDFRTVSAMRQIRTGEAGQEQEGDACEI